jgi:TIR domain-containing protein
MQAGEGAPLEVFYSYSHVDEEYRKKLGKHLAVLRRAGLIEVWHDRQMLPGDTVDEEIAEKLRSADLVLVPVSPSFIKSEYAGTSNCKTLSSGTNAARRASYPWCFVLAGGKRPH